MIKQYFTYDGKNSGDFGCFVANANQFDAPARDIESINIPGMNGALTIDNGRYNNLKLTYSMYVHGDVRTQIAGLRNYLSSVKGYKRLEDTYNPGMFYLARFIDSFSVSQSDPCNAGFNVTFDRKPQRFLKSGEMPIEVTGSTVIINETDQTAKPLIRAYGTGSFTIGSKTMTISSASVYTDIDCDIMEAYKGSTNCNGNVSGNFPVLEPGNNSVSLTGLTKLEITPRWWVL